MADLIKDVPAFMRAGSQQTSGLNWKSGDPVNTS